MINDILEKFIKQAEEGSLKTAEYPKEWSDLQFRISFGMGAPARVPWIAFIAPTVSVSNGYYPVYLYYKDKKTLILSYGLSETVEFADTWPSELTGDVETIRSYFNETVPRYGDSYVFKAYKIDLLDGITFYEPTDNLPINAEHLQSDLDEILRQYQQAMHIESADPTSQISQGVFYLEKQLEDFIIFNWNKTDLGQKYNLIIEDGTLLSQQYRTDIGPIDILARDKQTGSYVVIELKRNQTSDDTVGQVARYMGWVSEKMNDHNVRGIVIAGDYDRKLEYALKMVNNVETYIYEVDFKLRKT